MSTDIRYNCCCQRDGASVAKETKLENERILLIIRTLAPDLSEVDDKTILMLIDLHRPYVWKKRFGDLYEQALAYLVAHQAALYRMAESAGSSNAMLVSGPITSEHEGDLSRSYGSASSGSIGGSGKNTGTYDRTIYGMKFLELRNMCVIGAVTRFG